MSIREIPDNPKLDAQALVHPLVQRGADAGRFPVRPTVAHLGVIWGQAVEAGLSYQAANDIVTGLAENWADGGNARAGEVRHLPDDDILDVVYAARVIERVPDSDWGGLFDLGCGYGQRRQDGQSHERARYLVGEWLRHWYGVENPWPAPARPALTRLRVEDNKRWFANDAGRFDWREVSAFSLLSRLLTGESAYVRQYLAGMRSRGFTVVRVILTLDGPYWTTACPAGRSFRCAPDMPGYWEALDLLAAMTAEEGLYLRAVFLGCVEPFGGVWHADRRDVWNGSVRARGEAFTLLAASRLSAHPHVIGELANEPGQIGMRESFEKLVELGRAVKSAAPAMLLGGGAVDGPNDNDTTLCVSPFDYVDAHIERLMGVGGFEWVKRTGEYQTIDAEHQPTRMPFISGEPVNFGELRVDGRNGDVERSPSVAFAYGGVSRARHYNTCFHYDGGLWTTMPKPDTDDAIRAYMAALDAFPMLTEDKWRGHWAQSYWRQVWPSHDDEDTVTAHLDRGAGPWRVFGSGPYCIAFPTPKGWDYRPNLTATATQPAASTLGVYDASIYRRG